MGSTTPELCVTDAATIKSSAAEVASRLNGDGLSGLVNVAGIGMSGPLEYVTPEVVAAAVQDAVTSRHPKIRYVVGKDAKQLAILPRLPPDRWLDALRVRMLGLPAPVGNR